MRLVVPQYPRKPVPPLEMTTSSLPAGTYGMSYSLTLAGTGGVGPYSWSAAGLPGGMSLDPATGTLSGMPSSTGAHTVKVTLTDARGVQVERTFTFTVGASALAISTASLPAATYNASYSTAVASTGGYGTKTWTATGLPSGLSMSSAGTISGYPSAQGTFSVTVRVTDSLGTSVQKAFSLSVSVPALYLNTTSLSSGTGCSSYSYSLSASGGYGTYTWTVSGLPSGLTYSTSGYISGTPAQKGTFTVTLTVRDSLGTQASRSVSLTISGPSISVSTSSLAAGIQGTSYGATLSASGGCGTKYWTASGLPSGLSCSSDGYISGTPSVYGTFSVSVTVQDSLGTAASRTLSLKINEKPYTLYTTLTVKRAAAVVGALTTDSATLPAGDYRFDITYVTSSSVTRTLSSSATALLSADGYGQGYLAVGGTHIWEYLGFDSSVTTFTVRIYRK